MEAKIFYHSSTSSSGQNNHNYVQCLRYFVNARQLYPIPHAGYNKKKTIPDIDFAVRCLFISTATVNAGGRDRELNRIPVNWSGRVLEES